ncbi:MAG TPA: hypothetical protein VJN21_14695 [Candidatus Acidoferrales bacterium]|nr:hypothetical protein [Candidatus Acidoferrales bacterium]
MARINAFIKCALLVAVAAWCVPSAQAAQAQTATQAAKSIKQAVGKKPATKNAVAKKSVPRKAVAKKALAKPTAPAPGAQSNANALNAPAKQTLLTHLRDPFAALVRTGDAGEHMNLPPGIAGLQVATVRLQGLVKGPEGMIAVVANPQDRVYFLHEGDHIFDGLVASIDMDKITFQQVNKDAFGRPVQREIVKRLYPIAGEEQ